MKEKQIHLDAFETFLEYRLNNQSIKQKPDSRAS